MRWGTPGRNRILAIQPTSRGFGYAMVDLRREEITEYGVRRVRPAAEIEERALPKIAELIDECRPDAVLVEDTNHARSRRRGHPKAMIEGIVEVAEVVRLPLMAIPGLHVREHFRSRGAKNKDQIAALVANQFPNLRSALPPPRKIWKHHYDRMAVFDAVAFVIVFAAENPFAARGG